MRASSEYTPSGIRRKPECSSGGVDAATIFASVVDRSAGAACSAGRGLAGGSEPQATSAAPIAHTNATRSRWTSAFMIFPSCLLEYGSARLPVSPSDAERARVLEFAMPPPGVTP
jgi:hypothetical protein